MERILPDFILLVRFKEQGLTDAQVGKQFGVTPQAVNKILTMGGYYTREVSRRVIAEAIPWEVKRIMGPGSHHTTYLGKNVMAYLRVALGDHKVTDTHRIAAMRLRQKLVRDNLVIDYDVHSRYGFKFVPRQKSDGKLLFRWPEGRPLPEGDILNAITLSEA